MNALAKFASISLIGWAVTVSAQVQADSLNMDVVAAQLKASFEPAAAASGYKWSREASSNNSATSNDAPTVASASGYKWEAATMGGTEGLLAERADREYSGSVVSSETGYKWGLRSVADQTGYKWGLRSVADQAGYKWGLR